MDAANQKIGIVILAAGESRRLNYFPKQLLKFNEKTLICHAVENALNSSADLICVVLGANADQIKSEIKHLPVDIVSNQDWAEGMGSSLKTGLKRLLELEPQLSAVGITLCDQPLITSTIINQLVEAFQNNSAPIVAAEYDQTLGVPSIFAASMFDELLHLKPTEGAKKVITKNLSNVKKIAIPEAAYDIDTKGDFESFLDNNRPTL